MFTLYIQASMSYSILDRFTLYTQASMSYSILDRFTLYTQASMSYSILDRFNLYTRASMSYSILYRFNLYIQASMPYSIVDMFNLYTQASMSHSILIGSLCTHKPVCSILYEEYTRVSWKWGEQKCNTYLWFTPWRLKPLTQLIRNYIFAFLTTCNN